MKPELIVSGWHNTLIQDSDEINFLNRIMDDEIAYSIKIFWNPGRVAKLLGAKMDFNDMKSGYEKTRDGKHLRAIFYVFDTRVIPGMNFARMHNSARKYASSAIERLTDSFYELKQTQVDKIPVAILTSALSNGIYPIINEVDQFWDLKHIDASWMSGGSTLSGLTLRNYDDKTGGMKNIMGGIKPDRVVYVGGNLRDEPCAEIAGIFVVPPEAPVEFKQHMTKIYGDKVRTPKKGEVYKNLTMD